MEKQQLKKEQVTNDQRSEHLEAVLKTTWNVGKIMFQEKDPENLIQGVCDALTGNQWCESSWIILLDTDMNPTTSASAGMGKNFIAIIDQFKSGEHPYCCQLALENTGVAIIEDPETTCVDCTLLGRMAGGIVMTNHLESRGRMFGFLYVKIPKAYVLINEIQGLVEDVTRDLSFALYTAELEQQQLKVQNMLRKIYESGEIKDTDILISTYNWKDKLILIVEDYEASYLLLKEAIKKTRVQILWSMRGEEAIEICKSINNIDLVLLDIRLPDINGLEVAKQIRKFRNELPIIAMTAYSSKEVEKKSIEAGCNDYISKPIKPEVIISLIGKYLEETTK